MIAHTTLALQALDQAGYRRADPGMAARRCGARQFWRLLGGARRAHLWSVLRRRAHHLARLDEALAGRPVSRQRALGVRQVALASVVGSEGRTNDFDRAFRPLRPHQRDRWLSIFAARASGVTLPPVALIQVDHSYYVRDGHHRLSVARALGQAEVDALVTRWEVGPGQGQARQVTAPCDRNPPHQEERDEP